MFHVCVCVLVFVVVCEPPTLVPAAAWKKALPKPSILKVRPKLHQKQNAQTNTTKHLLHFIEQKFACVQCVRFTCEHICQENQDSKISNSARRSECNIKTTIHYMLIKIVHVCVLWMSTSVIAVW